MPQFLNPDLLTSIYELGIHGPSSVYVHNLCTAGIQVATSRLGPPPVMSVSRTLVRLWYPQHKLCLALRGRHVWGFSRMVPVRQISSTEYLFRLRGTRDLLSAIDRHLGQRAVHG